MNTLVTPVTVIKRYANRKLYSLASSQYITLGDVLAYVEEGTAIKVVSNASEEDLTNHTILSALAERGRGLSNTDVTSLLVKVAKYIGNTGTPVATTVGVVNE